MCDVPSIAVFCSESMECFPGIASRFFRIIIVIIIIVIIDKDMLCVCVSHGREENCQQGFSGRKVWTT
jgi:hypothetical protein